MDDIAQNITQVSTQDVTITLGTPDVTSLINLNDAVLDVTIASPEVNLQFTDVGFQGLPGAKGDTGNTGAKGDNLVYANLTEQERLEVLNQFDSAVGTTSYTNIFLGALLN